MWAAQRFVKLQKCLGVKGGLGIFVTLSPPHHHSQVRSDGGWSPRMEMPPCLWAPIQDWPALLGQIYLLLPHQCLPYFLSLSCSQLASWAWTVPFSSRSNNSGWAVFHLLSLDFGERNYGGVLAQDRSQYTFIGKRRRKEWKRDHHQNLISSVKIWTEDALNLPLVSGHAIFSHLDSSVYSLLFLICESSRYAH